ncbi:MAG TPA: hypothetical protein VFK57_20850 [Vicinamibacterales bacterium]|nr:hypothetical protein [Vicinamibacterales bacterium]
MASTRYRGRRAVALENDDLRVTVLVGGGHIAEVFHKPSGVNPLWTPPWPSIEPAAYDPEHHPVYGDGVDASLLAGIMGHNLCLDIFGGPSAEEAAAGLPVHGEVSTQRFDVERSDDELVLNTLLPMARLHVERRVALGPQPGTVRVRETVENLSAIDHPVGWTQHVTLGPPFLERGATQFRTSAGRSKVFPGAFGPADYLAPGAEFDWPMAPRAGGGDEDLRMFTAAPASSAYTAHLMREGSHAFFVAFSPRLRLAFGYVWRPSDFPWLGIWEENASRPQPPWNGRTLTRGMEFGVSPFPETRREMIERQRLFGVPTFRWIGAASRLTVEYWIVAAAADSVPETLEPPLT